MSLIFHNVRRRVLSFSVRGVGVATLLLVMCVWCTSARAESWIFKKSYYSHDPVTEVRIGPQRVPGLYYTPPQGEYFRSGYRYLHSTITAGHETSDQINVFESWIQTGTQF